MMSTATDIDDVRVERLEQRLSRCEQDLEAMLALLRQTVPAERPQLAIVREGERDDG